MLGSLRSVVAIECLFNLSSQETPNSVRFFKFCDLLKFYMTLAPAFRKSTRLELTNCHPHQPHCPSLPSSTLSLAHSVGVSNITIKWVGVVSFSQSTCKVIGSASHHRCILRRMLAYALNLATADRLQCPRHPRRLCKGISSSSVVPKMTHPPPSGAATGAALLFQTQKILNENARLQQRLSDAEGKVDHLIEELHGVNTNDFASFEQRLVVIESDHRKLGSTLRSAVDQAIQQELRVFREQTTHLGTQSESFRREIESLQSGLGIKALDIDRINENIRSLFDKQSTVEGVIESLENTMNRQQVSLQEAKELGGGHQKTTSAVNHMMQMYSSLSAREENGPGVSELKESLYESDSLRHDRGFTEGDNDDEVPHHHPFPTTRDNQMQKLEYNLPFAVQRRDLSHSEPGMTQQSNQGTQAYAYAHQNDNAMHDRDIEKIDRVASASGQLEDLDLDTLMEDPSAAATAGDLCGSSAKGADTRFPIQGAGISFDMDSDQDILNVRRIQEGCAEALLGDQRIGGAKNGSDQTLTKHSKLKIAIQAGRQTVNKVVSRPEPKIVNAVAPDPSPIQQYILRSTSQNQSIARSATEERESREQGSRSVPLASSRPTASRQETSSSLSGAAVSEKLPSFTVEGSAHNQEELTSSKNATRKRKRGPTISNDPIRSVSLMARGNAPITRSRRQGLTQSKGQELSERVAIRHSRHNGRSLLIMKGRKLRDILRDQLAKGTVLQSVSSSAAKRAASSRARRRPRANAR